MAGKIPRRSVDQGLSTSPYAHALKRDYEANASVGEDVFRYTV